METRVQYILLMAKRVCAYALLCIVPVANAQENINQQAGSAKIDNEFFEVGLTAGVVNIEDYGSEFIAGIQSTFKASESFFLQFNYLQTDVSLSAYEQRGDGNNQGPSDRRFTHYDLLVGYNVFQGEIFTSKANAQLSALYVVGGVGETEFGGEAGFTYVFGVGYQMALSRRVIMRFDNRNYLYDSTVLAEDEKVSNSVFSAGIGFLF